MDKLDLRTVPRCKTCEHWIASAKRCIDGSKRLSNAYCSAHSALEPVVETDTEMFEQACKDIVAHSDVHGHWYHEHVLAQAALDTVSDRRRIAEEERKKGT